jgi:hypothetical protein
MELSRDSQIQQKQPQAIVNQFARVLDLIQADAPGAVQNSIDHQLHNATEDPANTHLINVVPVAGKVSLRERLKIHNRKQRKANVRQHEEVRQALAHRFRRPIVINIVQVNDYPEHEH